MLDNVDYAGIIHVEYDQNENKYMSFKNIKKRIGCQRDYLYQPFREDNDLKLTEDLLLPVPVFKETLYEDPVFVREPVNVPVQNSRYGNLKTDDDNMFEFANRYSSVNLNDIQDGIQMPVSYSEIDRIREEEKELDERFPSKEKKRLFTHVA